MLKEPGLTSKMEKLAKDYPPAATLELLKVPLLDEELFTVLDQRVRNMDPSLQVIQKIMVSGISALINVDKAA